MNSYSEIDYVELIVVLEIILTLTYDPFETYDTGAKPFR